MTKVQFLTSIAGLGFAYQARAVVDLPDAIAAEYVATGVAKVVEVAASAVVEVATATLPSVALAPRAQGRRRKGGRH